MHIVICNKNGADYGKLCTSTRDGKNALKHCSNLGRVLVKDAAIYNNRERGVFTYDLATNTYGKAPSSFVPPAKGLAREKLLLDFGDAFILKEFIESSGILPAIDAIGYGNPDTIKAMVSYYILSPLANCHALDWWSGSYARILYPKANLTSQRISDFLDDIGDEEASRGFFSEYLPILGGSKKPSNVLIDSAGPPNSIRFPLTAVSSHNGEISNEVRLIYVAQQETGLPLFFRHCPRNVVDVSALTRTVYELKANGIKIKHAILDAGDYSDENIQELCTGKISFVTRLKENRKLYKGLVAAHIPGIERRENLIGYNGRYAYIKCVECELLPGRKAFAYVGLDIERKSIEAKKLFAKAAAEALDDAEVFNRLSTQGRFVLVSSKRLKTAEILPAYCTRQQIEQVFDIGKNYPRMMPPRVQGENVFRGHLLLTFIATVIVKMLQAKLKDSAFNPISLFSTMRNQKCKVFENLVLAQEPVKKANDCYKLLGIDCPVKISL